MPVKIIVSHKNSPAFNLAAEEYFFHESGEDILLLYVNESSVIAGANQAIENEVNLHFCKKNNITVWRRISGGGTVFHDLGNLNYCFIKCLKHEKYPLNSAFLNPVIDVMKAFSVPLIKGQRSDLWLPDGFKAGGTASYIRKNRILQHGTLLFDTDLEKLYNSLAVSAKDLTIRKIASVPSPVKNIKTYLLENNLPVFDSKQFFGSFAKKMSDCLQAETVSFSSMEISEITKLAEEKAKKSLTLQAEKKSEFKEKQFINL